MQISSDDGNAGLETVSGDEGEDEGTQIASDDGDAGLGTVSGAEGEGIQSGAEGEGIQSGGDSGDGTNRRGVRWLAEEASLHGQSRSRPMGGGRRDSRR